MLLWKFISIPTVFQPSFSSLMTLLLLLLLLLPLLLLLLLLPLLQLSTMRCRPRLIALHSCTNVVAGGFLNILRNGLKSGGSLLSSVMLGGMPKATWKVGHLLANSLSVAHEVMSTSTEAS
jgi:hypothetical protein